MNIEVRPPSGEEFTPVPKGTYYGLDQLFTKYRCLALKITDPYTGEELYLDKEVKCDIGGQCVTAEFYGDAPNGTKEISTHVTENDNQINDLSSTTVDTVDPETDERLVVIDEGAPEDFFDRVKGIVDMGRFRILARTYEEWVRWVNMGEVNLKYLYFQQI